MTTDFQDQSVIITGASSGIGRALALRLADQGAWVTLAARDSSRLEQVAEQCREHGGRALVVPTDVSDEAQCQNLVQRAVAEFGRLDMLINNAGYTATGLLEELPDLKLFQHVMQVNFYGQVYCTYYALSHLKETKGRLVSVSSLGGKMAIPYNTPYCSSKYGLHGFYDALRIELAPKQVSVTVICPWWVATEFHERSVDQHGMPRGEKAQGIYNDKTMTADQCARVVLNSAWKRKREVLMGPGPLGVWLKLISPDLVDWLVFKVFLEPASRRVRDARSKASE